ncbi:unnamed protein product [Mytilus edulis]|uniref:Ig-like domain-containing protein n=1 Tax=Mytilus edulis TaxID=6550 RepID=A0A8S3V0P1_MYTED|nr:unnamed protein product [Mytilus edulis]
MKKTYDLLFKTMLTLCFLGSSYQNTLLFSTQDFINELDLDSGNVTVLASGVDFVFSMDYDYKHGFVYLSRYYKKDIQKFNYTTVENIILETVIVTEYYPVGVAIDTVNSHVYWTEQLALSRQIRRCNFDGTNPVVILDEKSPWAISLDLINRLIYYGTFKGTIGRLEMNRTNQENIISNGIGHVSDLNIDMNSGYIYWIEYGSGDLKSATINGSNVNILFDGNSSNTEHGLDTDDKYIYFSSIKQLLRIQKFHENMEKEPYVLLNATETIYSVLMHKTKGVPIVDVGDTIYSSGYGEKITLFCNVISYPPVTKVYWEKVVNGMTIVLNSLTVGIEGALVDDPSLIIVHSTTADIGNYTCVARNSVGIGKSKATSLDVIVKQKIPIVNIESNNYVVMYGSSLTMACSISTSGQSFEVRKIYWKKNSSGIITTIVEDTDGISGSSIEVPSLTILNVTTSESGIYTCFAKNGIGTGQSKHINVTVTGGVPIVDVGDTLYSSGYGEKITLFCNMTSDPSVTKVYWEKVVNGTLNVLNSWTTGIKGASFDDPSLIIVHSTTADIGNYTCVATNSVGTGKSKATSLEVVGELPTVSVVSSLKPVKYGERVNILCVVKAFPIPTKVHWEKISNGITKVISNGTDGTDGITVENPSLILLHATDSDSGHYKCFAVNEFGLGYSSSVKLTVIGGLPEVSVPSMMHLTGTGYTITITCSVKNTYPEVSNVYWQRYLHGSTTMIHSNSIGIKGVTVENPSLIIPYAMESMTGEYICFAENSVGTGSSLPAKLTGLITTIAMVGAIAAVGSTVAAILAYIHTKKKS